MQVRTEKNFLAACQLSDAVQRAAFLSEACGLDSDLRLQIEQMLAAEECNQSNALDRMCAILNCETEQIGDGHVPKPGDTAINSEIGPYKLLEKIGEGGMGTVFLAKQKIPIRRTVATAPFVPGTY